jgi:hypothetical protein
MRACVKRGRYRVFDGTDFTPEGVRKRDYERGLNPTGRNYGTYEYEVIGGVLSDFRVGAQFTKDEFNKTLKMKYFPEGMVVRKKADGFLYRVSVKTTKYSVYFGLERITENDVKRITEGSLYFQGVFELQE